MVIASLIATGLEAVCIEGLNSLRLYNSNVTGNMDADDRNDCIWNVILYQSMSGDSEVGNSTFQMEGAFVQDESYAGEGGDGYANVWVSGDSTWTVTGDSTLSALHNAGTIVDGSGNTVSLRLFLTAGLHILYCNVIV